MMNIIGRKRELRVLQEVYDSPQAEFVAVYGRRRVGKTHLIVQFFNSKTCFFLYVVGMKDGSLTDQLRHFTQAVFSTFNPGLALPDYYFNSWDAALAQLTTLINNVQKKRKIILFFDELPWLATPRSKLLQSLEYHWNRHWVHDKRLKLVVCGSAASWMLSKIVYNKGGLHNRITRSIRLEPFTLSESKSYLHHLGIRYNNRQTLEIYMAIGGIPHYLRLLKPGLSPAQNISSVCFQPQGGLKEEFNQLFVSLFEESAAYEEIILLIAAKRRGLSRAEIIKSAKLSKDGGRLTTRLKELEEAGFIMSHIPWKQEQGIYYKVIDEYVLFYLSWIKHIANKKISRDYWQSCANSPAYYAWAGLSFEAVCEKHLEAIRKAIAIPDDSVAYSWQYFPKKEKDEEGAQIDLLFDRKDQIVTICEIKYTEKPFSIDKEYASRLLTKINVYRKQTDCKKEIFVAFISASGLKPSLYSVDLVTNEATLEDLFAESG
jgi:AAA+ ATPase superfamily predicted ATPase